MGHSRCAGKRPCLPNENCPRGRKKEIRALRGRLSAAEAKKRFGIGSTRLYKIWRDDAPQQPPPLLAPPVFRCAQNLLPYGGVAKAPGPTVEDFYKRLEGLESRAEHSTRLLVEVLAQLARNNTQDAFLDELEEEREEEAQTETRMDIQKVGQMVETAQKWTYLSLAAILVWKVIGATWKQCAPAAEHNVQEHAAAPPPQEVADPKNPHYME